MLRRIWLCKVFMWSVVTFHRFREDHLSNVMSKFQLIKNRFDIEDEVTFIGVHYRGTDYVDHMIRTYDVHINVSWYINTVNAPSPAVIAMFDIQYLVYHSFFNQKFVSFDWVWASIVSSIRFMQTWFCVLKGCQNIYSVKSTFLKCSTNVKFSKLPKDPKCMVFRMTTNIFLFLPFCTNAQEFWFWTNITQYLLDKLMVKCVLVVC